MTQRGRKKGKQVVENKDCLSCNLSKKPEQFYLSNSEFHTDGRYPVCKDCLKSKIDTEKIDTVQNVLLEMNRPYLHDIWVSSKEQSIRRNSDLVGLYVKNISMPQNRHLTWKDSTFEATKVETIEKEKQMIAKDDFHFKVTNEMIMRWGSKNYTEEDYMKLEDFYNKMKDMNRIETPQEETYLKKLAVISLKMDQELENGNYGQVKQLGDLFSKYMADSKFRAMDKSEADKTGGIRSFSAIFAEVEKDDYIPPWEQYRKIKGISQDIIDQTIMHIENFTLRLNKIERMVEPPSDTPKVSDST